MIPVVDGHNDALLRVWRSGGSLREREEAGHLDLPRMREGGIAAGFFAIFVPAQDEDVVDPRTLVVRTADGHEVPLQPPLPLERAARIADEIAAIAERDLFLVRTLADLERCIAGEEVGAILHFEGAEPIAPGLGNLDAWYARGLRSLGLVWSRPNAFAEGVPFRIPSTPDTGPGLTAAGRRLVRECNRLRIVLDLAHLNERGFRDVAALTDAPLVVTHSGAHAVCPHSRNLLDSQLDLIRDSGGVVGVVFDVPMTSPDGTRDPATPLDVLVRHVDHLAGRMGIEHVALGSDFDGAMMPDALGDAAGLPRLLDALERAGYRGDDLAALAHGNWLRVLRATWGA